MIGSNLVEEFPCFFAPFLGRQSRVEFDGLVGVDPKYPERDWMVFFLEDEAVAVTHQRIPEADSPKKIKLS
jgi:hypothetical protein